MSTAKDLEMSPFEAARRLLSFEGDGLSLKWVHRRLSPPAASGPVWAALHAPGNAQGMQGTSFPVGTVPDAASPAPARTLHKHRCAPTSAPALAATSWTLCSRTWTWCRCWCKWEQQLAH